MFDGKTIYIPGGSSGIGLAAAKQLAGKGANVFIFARNPEKLEDANKEISGCKCRSDQRFGFHVLDVGNAARVDPVMENAVAESGAPDVLINTAGLSEPGNFENISHDQFDRIMKANVYGTWNTIHALLPVMKKNGGHIVNTSSIAGFIGVFGYTDYCTSKFAVVGLSEALRMELKPHGIVVSVLCPPDTDTPMLTAENKVKPPETKALAGGARILSADKVAADMIRGVEKNRFLIVPGFEGKAINFLRRLWPGLVMRFMDNTVKKVQAAADNIPIHKETG